jgi:hypothetical protein
MDEPNTLARAAMAERPMMKEPRIAALDILEEGLNRFSAELEQFEARLQPVLHDVQPEPSADMVVDEPVPTHLHGQALRLHMLVNALNALNRRVGI